MADDTAVPTDPTTLAHIAVPPALIQEVQENPEALVQITRGQLMVVQDRMVRLLLSNPEATASQYAVVHERLSKNASIEPKNTGQNAGAQQVIINIVRGGQPAVTIESSAQQVSDGDVD